MARNLRSKISPKDSLVVYDVNRSATQQFMQELEGQEARATTNIAEEPKEVAEESVRMPLPPRKFPRPTTCDPQANKHHDEYNSSIDETKKSGSRSMHSCVITRKLKPIL